MSLQPSNLEETFLTVAEVAEMLKLNQQTVRNWIDQGRLPALRVGRRVRIRRSDLERVLEESSITVPGSPGRGTRPSAEDFWGGEPIAVLDPGIGSSDGTALGGAGSSDGPPHAGIPDGADASAEGTVSRGADMP
jgi:excisionase family DNA binding protein